MPVGDFSGPALELSGDLSNVLVLDGPPHQTAHASCRPLLQFAPPDDLALVLVSFWRTPEQLVSYYRDRLGSLPASVQVVSVGPQASLGTPGSGDGDPSWAAADERLVVRTTEDSDNLTRLGVQLTECLEAVDAWDDVPSLAMCFRSLSPPLIHANHSTVLKFLQVLTDHTAGMDGVAHYHLDPKAHDEQVVRRIAAPFDAVVEYDDRGERVVKSR